MSVITLAEAKLHLRISASVTSPDPDNDLIQAYIDAAEDFAKNYLNCRTLPRNASVKAACLLMTAELYEHREVQVVGSIIAENPTIYRLLYPYRRDIGI